MPRFSVAFSKRKSAADVLENAPRTSPEAPSFRVIERSEIESGRSFDGGARMSKSKSFPVKTNLVDLGAEENMFADLKINRGSNISNTTKGTSTDNSSRHSNASTAPSSADMTGSSGYDDNRPPPKSAPQDSPNRIGHRSIGSGLLDRATRTFSFGGQKKHSIPPPKQDPIPDMPPVLSLGGANHGALRGPSPPAVSNAMPSSANTEDRRGGGGGSGGGTLDLGGDFGSMFKSFDKRASTATLTLANQESTVPRSLTGNRYDPSGPDSSDHIAPSEPLLNRRHSPAYSDDTPTLPTSPHADLPPPVPRHEHLNSFKYSDRPADLAEDEDAKLLRDSFTAMKLLSDSNHRPQNQSCRSRNDDESITAMPSQSFASNFDREENIFEGSLSKINRPSNRYAPRSSNTPRNKVMTPAQFEKYRQDKEGLGTAQQLNSNIKPVVKIEDDDDEINYDDDEDEQEKSKQQAKQRRKQEAHMAVYRQQMMKVTGESNATPLPTRQPLRPGMISSSSAPALNHLKAPSPDPAMTGASSEEDDEDVPLAILQAHGFPAKNRPPTRLSTSGSNPNLRASAVGQPTGGRAPSVMGGDTASINGRRHSTLPAFARNLPQDPFVGASIARPAIRESMMFGNDARQPSPQPPQQGGPLPPGGLVGVIANEERSRALRRGSPSIDPNKLIGGAMNANGNLGYDPYGAMPAHMMYQGGGGMLGVHGMPQMNQMPPQPMLTPGDQAQIQMTQQMQQFMQMQMQFMQMMAGNPNGGGAPSMHQQSTYGGYMPGNQSMGDLSRHSMMVDPMMEPRRMDPGMRTMSMVQPSSASFMGPVLQGPPSIRGFGGQGGYSPSIAPSERSNVGLPGRYRPVSQAPAQVPLPDQHIRSNTMSGGLSLSNWSDDKSKSTVKLMGNSREGSDDDEEQGWEAMKAKRDKKRSLWKTKRHNTNHLDISF